MRSIKLVVSTSVTDELGFCSKFLEDLRKCVDRPELLGPLFRRFLEKRMFMYEHYCRNKPVSEYIVSDHDHYFQELRNKLNQKLQVCSTKVWRVCSGFQLQLALVGHTFTENQTNLSLTRNTFIMILNKFILD